MSKVDEEIEVTFTLKFNASGISELETEADTQRFLDGWSGSVREFCDDLSAYIQRQPLIESCTKEIKTK